MKLSTSRDIYQQRFHKVVSHLPEAMLIKLDQGEGHFIFIGACTLPLEVMGVPLCRDKPGVERAMVQQKIVDRVVSWLPDSWAVQ